MTGVSLPQCPTFPEWYRAVNHREPFPWQTRLANRIANGTGWPDLVGVQTGLGKTACIDIAIWVLASQAHLPPTDRTAPVRLWWVVNRRLLVDNTYEHALRVANQLSRATEGHLANVAARLRRIAGNATAEPLEVIRMRGGQHSSIQRTSRPSTPAQPAVICSTIPMFGSRVLFRGYGTSRSMRPIDAALAYTDSLVIIDEAHLAVHLQRLLADLAAFRPPEVVLPEGRQRPVIVALTATGDPDIERFELGEDDHQHPTILQRLHAAKPIRVEISETATTFGRIAAGVVSALKELLNEADPGVSLVFTNSPVTARAAAKRLRRWPNTQVVVVTGQIRGYEAEKVTDKILSEAAAGRAQTDRDQHLVIVATQTLEVGADIDADYLVTEGCGVRALTQRLGRLNRLGTRPHAKGSYVHTPGKDDLWPVYRKEPAEVLKRLQKHANDQGEVELSPATIGNILGDPQDNPDPAPVIAPGIVWEWTKTTTPPPGEAPTHPYFAGMDEQSRHVNVAWRAHLPEDEQKLWPRLGGNEMVEVLVSEAKRALQGVDDGSWALLDSKQRVTYPPTPEDLGPGDTVLVRSDVGLLDSDGHWDPKCSAHVRDVSILRSGIALAPGVVTRIYMGTPPVRAEQSVCSINEAINNNDAHVVETQCHLLCEALSLGAPSGVDPSDWSRFVGYLDGGATGQLVLEGYEYDTVRLVPSRVDTAPPRPSDEDDELSVRLGADDPSALAGHGDHTGTIASVIAAAVGIERSLITPVIEAARLHDIGKADSRFQRSLNPDWEPHHELQAKSGAPRSAWSRNRTLGGWPRGGRHEELSRRLIADWLASSKYDMDDQHGDLLQHLVVSHHGHGRPLVPPVKDNTGGPSLTHQINGVVVTAAANLDTPDWKQPARFASLNERYGPWGLALMETIVRQSDHIASSATDIQ